MQLAAVVRIRCETAPTDFKQFASWEAIFATKTTACFAFASDYKDLRLLAFTFTKTS